MKINDCEQYEVEGKRMVNTGGQVGEGEIEEGKGRKIKKRAYEEFRRTQVKKGEKRELVQKYQENRDTRKELEEMRGDKVYK